MASSQPQRDGMIGKLVAYNAAVVDKAIWIGMKKGLLSFSAVARVALDEYVSKNWRRCYGPTPYDTGIGGDTSLPPQEPK